MNPEGELPSVRAAGAMGDLFVLSGTPSVSIKELDGHIAGPWWKQIFLFRDRGINKFVIGQAESLGCGAVVLTVSNIGAPTYRQRPPRDSSFANQAPYESRYLEGYGGSIPESLYGTIDQSLSWKDIEWLRSVTAKPLVIKGVQTAEDARLCVEHGIDGLVVSNHGGRFSQGTQGTIDALPEVISAVNGKMEVYLDGGIGRGEDALKALALGARSVWIGRAARWALTVSGENGVRQVLDILHEELSSSMALCGVSSIADIGRALVTAPSK
jgi:isopentenyl diphosphate isomerase/L-lactate dehydrogenase-like FMN-dependent dehydrogenase